MTTPQNRELVFHYHSKHAFEVLKARAAGHELRRLQGYVDHAQRAAFSMPWVADLDGEAI